MFRKPAGSETCPRKVLLSLIPISVIIEQIAEGASWDELLVSYPELKREDIQAALFYARETIEHTDIRIAYA